MQEHKDKLEAKSYKTNKSVEKLLRLMKMYKKQTGIDAIITMYADGSGEIKVLNHRIDFKSIEEACVELLEYMVYQINPID